MNEQQQQEAAPRKVRLIETEPGIYTISDSATAIFSGVNSGMSVAAFDFMATKLKLTPPEVGFIFTVLVAGNPPPGFEPFAGIESIEMLPLVPHGMGVTTSEVGHG